MSSALGVVCAFAYPLMFAANNLIAKHLVGNRNREADSVLFNNHLVTVGFMLLAAFLVPHSFENITASGIGFSFGGAFFNGFLALLLFYASLRYITAGRANIVRAIGPVIVTAMAYVFFPVPITWQLLVGAALLIGATTIVAVNQTRQEA